MNTTPEGLEMTNYTLEEELELAKLLGAQTEPDSGRGGDWCSFSYPVDKNTSWKVWACQRAWAVAKVDFQYYRRQAYFSTLEEALAYARKMAKNNS